MSKRQVFISHRNSEHSNRAARKIEEALLAKGYKVFFDESSLRPGYPWDEDIINALRNSEAVVLVIDDTTIESDWVQREADTARALRVSILPVMLDLGDKEKQDEAYKRLNLGTIQYQEFDIWESDNSAETVAALVAPLLDETLKNQTESWNNWHDRQEALQLIETTPQVEQHSVKHRLTHPDIPDVVFHIATGDATRLEGYDVLVNSENTHMQMARYFERNTLSRQVRLNGAYVLGGRVKIDFIQEELFDQVKFSEEFGELPIVEKQVVVTSAGHSKSKLRKRGFRFILHAASVTLSDDGLHIRPLAANANIDIVENCFERLIEIDQRQGHVLSKEAGQRIIPEAEKQPYQNLQSVLFPVFGSGQGGNPFKEAVEAIIKGFRRFTLPAKRRGMTVERIGLCVYDMRKVEIVKSIFLAQGFKLEDA